MPNLLFTLALGFILGIKHSFEADHIIAISTIVSEHKNPFKAALIGTFWGIGHTTTIFIIGIAILLLKLTIPAKLSISLEGLAGVLLVMLGVRVLIRNRQLHTHTHTHEDITHNHLHYQEKQNAHKHHLPFLMGLIHGIAGSGVLMLLVLSTVANIFEGLYYILLFGFGSIVGMSTMSFIIGVPFFFFKGKKSSVSSANRLPRVEMYFRYGAGILSILFGLFIIFETSRIFLTS